ncbi:MAG TPA: hypothetical protein VMV46_15670 [Thermoanaerobaculia bacterium]|nr:hypothetical protein [Thermoanaerobaculia bacterium]
MFSFGEDEDGGLYVAAGNAIYRIVDALAIAFDGFESGDLTVWTKSKP